jgi:thiamine biosynthesis lipoprotein
MPSLSQQAKTDKSVRAHGRRLTRSTWVQRARPLLGTLVSIGVADERQASHLHQAIDAAFACIECVHRLMSLHAPDSELCRLNRQAAMRPQKVDLHTYAVFAAALRFADLSQGAFDPCIAPRLESWGLLPQTHLPHDPSSNWRAIELLTDQRIRYSTRLRVDLGGIAKGYAVDLAVQCLQRFGLSRILVNAGGDLRVAGLESQCVRLRCPAQPSQSLHELTLRDTALATSAGYFSRRESVMGLVSALVDPANGSCYLGGRSVSVRATDCMTADALTKVVLFAPPALAESVLAACDAQAFVV